MEDIKDMNDIHEEVVEPQKNLLELEDSSDLDSESDSSISEKTDDVADHQTEEQNRIYKNMRLKAEAEARKELDEERKKLEELRLETRQAMQEKKVLDEYLDPRRIEDFADSKGVSDAVAKEMLMLQAKEAIQAEKYKVAETFSKMQAKKMELRTKHPQFMEVEKEVDDILAKHADATEHDYEKLYYYLVGKNHLSVNSNISKATEKKVIAEMHDKARRKNVGSSTGSSNDIIPSAVLTQKGMAMSNAFGNDPRKIAEYVKKAK